MVPDTRLSSPVTGGFKYTNIFNCFPGSLTLAHTDLQLFSWFQINKISHSYLEFQIHKYLPTALLFPDAEYLLQLPLVLGTHISPKISHRYPWFQIHKYF
jgi:hypothetical protein